MACIKKNWILYLQKYLITGLSIDIWGHGMRSKVSFPLIYVPPTPAFDA